MAMFRSLAFRPFALLWGGQTISRLGDSLYRIALAWWVLEKTGSAAIMGTVLVFSFTPMLIFALIGGVFVDRFPRLTVMIISDLLRGLAVGLVAFLAFTKMLEVWHIYAASTLFGLVDAFFQPAYVAVLPDLAPREILPSANSLTNISGQVASIAGPGIGGLLVGLGGTPTAFLLNSISFFVSAACIAPLLKIPLPDRAQARPLRLAQDLMVGVKAVLASPWLWVTIGLAALANVTVGGPMSVSLPFLVKDVLHQGASIQGLIVSVSSAGAVLGAVWLGSYTRLRRRGLIAYVGWAIGGLMVTVYGLGLPLPVILVAAAINGLTFAAIGLVWTNTLQELVPGELLGRVSSIDMLGSFVLLPVGYAVAGALTDKIGPALVFALGGLVTAALALVGLMHPAIRRLD